MNTISLPAVEIPVYANVDVLVVGGGPTGIMAAQAAAAKGMKVMIVESRGYLGGNLTTGLPILGFLGRKGNQIIKGLPQKFIDRLAAKGGATGHRACPLHVSLTIIDPEMVKLEALDIMAENNVEVLFYAFCSDVIKEGDVVKGIVIDSKAGREAILAKTVIDCTGDGDVAFRAGCECIKGGADGGMQPPTLMFNMKGVDVEKLRLSIADNPEIYDMDTIPNEFFRKDEPFITVGLRGCIQKARAEGIEIPVERTIMITGLRKDEMWINMSRVSGVDSTDPRSYTHGEIVARHQNEQIIKYLKKFVPGYENAWLDKTAAFMGIRESRQVMGQYVLTDKDILSCRRFDDAVAVASYPVDIHHSTGGDCSLYWCEDCYDIPYRCLVPNGVKGLLVAGRCISASHEAMASTRVMSTCMAMGEAAGKAAAMAVAASVDVADVNVAELRASLLADGAYLN